MTNSSKKYSTQLNSLIQYTPLLTGIDRPNLDQLLETFQNSNRSNQVLINLSRLYNFGRLGGSGYLSILPVDQGIEHSAGSSFAPNPIYFDPENIVKLALESGCNGVASSVGALGLVSRKYAHRIPFIVKLNHNQLLSYPNQIRQTMYASVTEAWNLGASGVGATIYFGSSDTNREIEQVVEAFEKAHSLGLFTVLWCYVRNNQFKVAGKNYETSSDLTAQANHLGVSIQADIIKQKLPTLNGGFVALNTESSSYGKFDPRIYSQLCSDNPIDLARYQVLNCFGGKIPLISSGGESGGSDDNLAAAKTAIINKKAGGSGLIMGRKAFQREFKAGIEILNLVQDIYLDDQI
jgi:class I fructose-bisphosphate aldolase